MKQKDFNLVAGTIFILVAALHFIRAISGWELVIGGTIIPAWISMAVAILLGCMTYKAFRLTSK